MVKDERIEEFVKELKRCFGKNLKEVILFGSRARGDSVEGSDYDFLLIFKEVEKDTKEFVDDLASGILIEYGKLFSTFLLTQQQLERMRFEPFIMNAQKEGVLL